MKLVTTSDMLDACIRHIEGYLNINMSTEKQKNISLFYHPFTRTLKRGQPLRHIIIGTQLRELYWIFLENIGVEAAFGRLIPLLEDRYLDKVVYDGRYLSDILKSTHDCHVSSFLDVQLLEVMNRDAPNRTEHSEFHAVAQDNIVTPRVMDIGNFIRTYYSQNRRTEGGADHSCEKEESNSLVETRCSLLSDMWMGRKEVDLESAGDLFALVNDAMFSFIERMNPNVSEWTRWWVNSSRYADSIRTKVTRNYDKYDINNFLPLNILCIAKSPKIGAMTCTYCLKTLTIGCFERSRTKSVCKICQMINNRGGRV